MLEERPADLRTLVFVARLPFVHVAVIEHLVGLRGGASIYRSLARLRASGLLASIRRPLYSGHSQNLYYLTDLGLAILALQQGTEVAELVRHLHVDARHPLALVPHLGHLVSATVPAYAAPCWDGDPGAYFLVPDRGMVPLHLYHPMLDHLVAMRRMDGDHFPILVVATWTEDRLCGWRALLEEVRHLRGDSPLAVQLTCRTGLCDGLEGIEALSRRQQLTEQQVRQG